MDDASSITMYQACLLHSRADRALRLVVSKKLDQFNVTLMEWLLMGTVKNGPKEGMTMSAVAATLDVTLPQVTALITNLTKHKLLKQKISRQDRRSRRLVSTNAGNKLVENIEQEVDQAMRDWVNDIPSDQLQTYIKTIAVLAERKPSDDNVNKM